MADLWSPSRLGQSSTAAWVDAEMSTPEPPELLVVVGPTATGKTELAVRLCQQLDGEVVSADSVQVYRRFDIGSGKPTHDERALAPHHLIDIVEPTDTLDAARYASLADAAITGLLARGKRPILCGGTFLWIKAVLYGLSGAPPADEVIRARHRRLRDELGPEALHADLATVDPASAARLNPNDFMRTSRALEVFELSGRKQSEWHAEHGFRAPRYRATLLGVQHSREAHDARIADRVRQMFEAGWLEEVRALMSDGLGDCRAMNSVGYRQVRDALAGGGIADPAALRAEIVRATRVFARRQRTWLRDQPVTWLEPGVVPRDFLGCL